MGVAPTYKYRRVNLIIDQGNTICKVAVCQGGVMQEILSVGELCRTTLEQILHKYPKLQRAVYSSVGKWDDSVAVWLEELGVEVVCLAPEVSIPLACAYDRQGLGSDRLAAVVGAWHLSPHTHMLVLDAGTAITYERISAEGVYLGGNISPGLHVRLKGLNHFTKRLPLVDEPRQELGLGTNTISAISRGVLQGVIYEIEGYINALRAEYPEAIVYITGGDADRLAQLIRCPIQVEPDLVMIGLNEILEYNVSHDKVKRHA